MRGELQSFGRGVAMWKELAALDSISSSRSYTTFTPFSKAWVNRSAKRGVNIIQLAWPSRFVNLLVLKFLFYTCYSENNALEVMLGGQM